MGVPGSEKKKPNLVEVELPWRRFYLRRRVLAAFAVVFATHIIALEVLGDISNRHAGLGDGATLRPTGYLWTYLPILALTVLSGVWSRVDYQAKAAAPWIRMAKGGGPAEKTLLLDYVNMAMPVSVFRAVVNGDVVVACTAVVKMHLGLLVVMATALMTMSLVDVPGLTTPVELRTGFVDNGTGLRGVDDYAFYAMVGAQQDGLRWPEGVAGGYAFQQFEAADGMVGREVRATVDGFSAGLDCEVAKLELGGARYFRDGIQLNTTVSVSGCTIEMPIVSQGFVSNSTVCFARFAQGGCGGSDRDDNQRIVVVFGSELVDGNSLPNTSAANDVPVNATISQSMQLICTPTYAISRLDVKKSDMTLIDLDLSDTNNRTLSNVQPWDIAQAFFASYSGPLVENFTDTSPWFYQPATVMVDPAMYLALGMRRLTAGAAVLPSMLFDETTLQSVASDYYQQYTALLASRALMEQISDSTTGTVMLRGERLLVRSMVVQGMVSMFGVSLILTIVAICFVPRKGFLPRDPNTIIDTAALIAHSRPLLQSLRGAGGGSDKVLRDRLGSNNYSIGVEAYEHGSSDYAGYFKILGGLNTKHGSVECVEERHKFSYPINLHPLARIAAAMGVIVLIVLLEVSLRMSESKGGLFDVMDDTYLHLLWTAMPALVLSHFAQYFASVDWTTRALAPYAALSEGGSFEKSVTLNYLDKTTPFVIYASVKSRNFGVVATGLAVVISSLLMAFVAPIFGETTVAATMPVQLLAQDSLLQRNGPRNPNVCVGCQNGTVVASLILGGNLSYPAFTYEDLVFPTLKIDPRQAGTYPGDVVITVDLPAIRPQMACQVFTQAEITTVLPSGSPVDTNNPIRVDLPGEPTNTLSVKPTDDGFDTSPFFGAAAYKPLKLAYGTTVSHWVYTWGQLTTDSDQPGIKSIYGMSCNETFQEVKASTNFHGTNLRIFPWDPPVVDESTVTPVAIDLNSLDYDQLASISTTNILDPFFAHLVASRYAVPVESLAGDPQTLADAIAFQHKLIRAQVISTESRHPLNSGPQGQQSIGDAHQDTSTTSFSGTAITNTVIPPSSNQPPTLFRRADPSPPSTPATPSLTAHRRLTQDPIATRILQAALSTTLFLSLLSWALNRNTRIHPRPSSPNSIASVAALLADGNTFGLLGRTAEWASTEELRVLFMDGLHVAMGFKMGWEAPRGRRRAAGNEKGGRVLGVSAVRTGGWGGGEGVGLGLMARVGYVHRGKVRDWGWRT